MLHTYAPPVAARPLKIVALASGAGSVLEAVLQACASGSVAAEVVAVGADRQCGALDRAAGLGVGTFVVSPTEYPSRGEWDAALIAAVAERGPDLVLCLGYMRIVSAQFLAAFPARVLNTHPSLLPSFPGARAVKDALEYGVKVTGCTIHLVDEGMDTGPIVAQVAVAVNPGDTEVELHERIKSVERTLVVSTLAELIEHGMTIDGRKVGLG